ncbi:hypothetical protein NUBL21995_31380 [Klebsiella pneumoniae]|nr:hypothetical protein NUBL21995_31380 [Klebsiella pneumoniae]
MSDEIETIDKNPKSWAAWKREAERLQAIIDDMALAAMDSSESIELPLDYLQGHKDGLEWAAQLAEANHPETGDWLYDDPIELAKAIRKGPDMPPVQPVADSEPVIVVGDDGGDALSYRRLIQSFEPGTKLYRHAQPAPAVPGKWIPVSERMPEDDDFVYIWPRPDFGVELHIGQYCERNHKGGGWYAQVYEQNYGIEWHPITVTHWMPLPAGPQGVKGE